MNKYSSIKFYEKASVVKLVDTLDSKSGSFGSGGSSPPTGTKSLKKLTSDFFYDQKKWSG